MTLFDAAYALNELASARAPNNARLVTGAAALHALQAGTGESDWHRAAVELRFMAAVGPLILSADARDRFKAMSDCLQGMASKSFP